MRWKAAFSVPLLAILAACGPTTTSSGGGSTLNEKWEYVSYEQRTLDSPLGPRWHEMTKTMKGGDPQALAEVENAFKQAGCRFSITAEDVRNEQDYSRLTVENLECTLRELGPMSDDEKCAQTGSFEQYRSASVGFPEDDAAQYQTEPAYDHFKKQFC